MFIGFQDEDRDAQESAECKVWRMTMCNSLLSGMPLAALAEKVQTFHLGSLGAWLRPTQFSGLLGAPVSSFPRQRQSPAAVDLSGV